MRTRDLRNNRILQRAAINSLFEKYICRVRTAHQPLTVPAGSTERIAKAIEILERNVGAIKRLIKECDRKSLSKVAISC